MLVAAATAFGFAESPPKSAANMIRLSTNICFRITVPPSKVESHEPCGSKRRGSAHVTTGRLRESGRLLRNLSLDPKFPEAELRLVSNLRAYQANEQSFSRVSTRARNPGG